MKKKFIVSIYIQKNRVYMDAECKNDITDCLYEKLRLFGDANADEVIAFTEAEGDAEKEEVLALLKEISNNCEIPVMATFPIERVEDVKKMVYANCKKVILNLSKTSNWEMLEEVSKRFGADKIAVSIDDCSLFNIYRQQAEKYATEFVALKPMKPQEYDGLSALPGIFPVADVMLEKLLEIFGTDCVGGIYGNVMNSNIEQINSIKALCVERGIEVNALIPSIKWEELKLNSDGLVPVIAQDYKTGEVLMMAYMNKEAYENTLKTGKMNYYSRSRQSQWEKGETSGHFQYVKSLYADCDNDTILAKISQIGPACHTGSQSCFFKEIASKPYAEKNPLKVFEDVYGVIADRKVNPKEGSYTNYLFDKGVDKILKKLGEEATEIVIAAKNPEAGEIKYEISDFLYHMMVLMVEKDITWEEITSELAQR